MSEDNDLSTNLKDYAKSIQEEFEVSTKGSSDEIAKNAQSRLSQLLPEATKELASILKSGTKDDAIRLSACKLVFEYTLGKPVPATGQRESDLEKLFGDLLPKEEIKPQEEGVKE